MTATRSLVFGLAFSLVGAVAIAQTHATDK